MRGARVWGEGHGVWYRTRALKGLNQREHVNAAMNGRSPQYSTCTGVSATFNWPDEVKTAGGAWC
jgi:hypothetical protein